MDYKQREKMVREYLVNSVLDVPNFINTCDYLRIIPQPEEKGFMEGLIHEFNFATDNDMEDKLDLLWILMRDCIPTSEFGLLLLNPDQLRYFQPWCDLDDQMCVINPSVVATAGSDGFIPLNFILYRAELISNPMYCKERKPRRSREKRCPIDWFNDHFAWDKATPK